MTHYPEMQEIRDASDYLAYGIIQMLHIYNKKRSFFVKIRETNVFCFSMNIFL